MIRGLIHVAKNGDNAAADGSVDKPFLTIQAAIDYAVANFTLDSLNQVVVQVGPGLFEEQLCGRYRITVKGSADVRWNNPTILKNTGSVPGDYPLKFESADDYMIMEDMMIIAGSYNGILGYFPKAARFKNCGLSGRFIETSLDTSGSYHLYLEKCDIADGTGKFLDLTGVDLASWRKVEFQGCRLEEVAPTVSSTHLTSGSYLQFRNCYGKNIVPSISGDWRLEGYNSRLAHNLSGSMGRLTFGAAGRPCEMINCELMAGLHFTANPGETFAIQNCSNNGFDVSIPDGEGDITADVDLTDCLYQGNIQHNGLDGEVKLAGPLRNVGGNATNKFRNIQEAINSITTVGIIKVFENYSSLAELLIPNDTTVVLDGQRAHSLSFTGDIAELGSGEKLSFAKFTEIAGGDIEVNGNNAEIHICDNADVVARILVTAGTGAVVHVGKSTLVGPTGKKALQINSVNPTELIEYSLLKGATGHSAIDFSVAANNCLQVKFSTLLHGDLAGNDPITRSGGDPIVSVYCSAGNSNLTPPATITNDVSSAGNVADPQIDF